MRKKQFRLNLEETFEKRISLPEHYYNAFKEKKKEHILTPNNVEKSVSEIKGRNKSSPHDLRSSNLKKDEQQEFKLGDTVMISGQECGVIRYLGNVHFQVILYYARINGFSVISVWTLGWY